MSTGLRFTLEVDGLPPDAFAVVSFHLNQSLSSLFSLDLSLVSQQFLSLEFAQVLDKMAYLTIWQGDEVQRRVKGVVTWFELGENDKNQMLYSMKVHPPLWRAGLRQNFRIFQNEDIKSILGTMLQENGVTEWSPLFSEPHPSREFCVQYGETDYDFLCRMAAEEGIFFYEEHAYKSTDQSLVLCDTVRHLPESFEIPWNPNTRTEVSTLCISQFRYSAQIRPSSVVTKDYTFKRPGWPGRFDQEGQYLKAQSAGRHRISEETDQYAGGHRLKQAGNTQYDYDAAGRMVSRTKHRDGYRPETERFRWDSRDQLTGYCSAQGEQWEYRHDASGRRTEKRCDRKKIRFTYLWDGDSIAEIREYRDDKLYSVRHLVFNGFELISQQFSRVRQPHPSVAPLWVTRTNHAVSDLTGRPLMLFNSEGKTVWRPGQTSLWGLALSLPADTGYPDPRGELDPEAAPGLLYAGQWQDAESGLCYNRFRYYEPESGMYLVSDPLGLLGGEQTYRYVPNPCGYVDPLGLAFCPRMQKTLQKLTDKAVADIIANPRLAEDLMSAGSYAHLKNGTNLYAASFGKAVERRVAQLVSDNSRLSKLVEHTGQAKGANGQFISSPDFTTKGKGVFDVTTNKALQAHIYRYTKAGVYTPHNDIGYLVYDVVYGLSF
ncbi:type VI secretion system tip protein TssI/VgrG [Escherichia coli]